MRSRPVRALEVLSISALDLFASALGVFILMAVLLFPYYLRQPSVEAEVAGARSRLASAEAALTQARQHALDAERRRDQAEAHRLEAIAEQAEAERALAVAERTIATARVHAEDVGRRQASLEEELANLPIVDLDLVFVMDATGSMRDEIQDVQRSLLSIIRVLERFAPSLRIGFVAYKDRTDEYLTQTFPLVAMTRESLPRIQAFVRGLQARGGGDTPEPVGLALGVAYGMPWRSDARGRIVVIGDAPVHDWDRARTLEMASQFHRSRPPGRLDRRISAIFTGRSPAGRRFFEQLALAGGGDMITHRGQMMESVLLSILDSPSRASAGSTRG